MAARQGEQLLAVGGARPVEPPEAQYDPRPARLRESVHIRLRGKVPARHRIAVDGRVLVNPTCAMVAVQHADRLLDHPVNAGGNAASTTA